MNLKLKRYDFIESGVFGILYDSSDRVIAYTLEHSYLNGSNYSPKVQPGTYNCIRGVHKLANLIPFETFEVTGVDGHDNILFHAGNTNKDSSGCILLGQARVPYDTGFMITHSKDTFEHFMLLQEGVNLFTLVVE